MDDHACVLTGLGEVLVQPRRARPAPPSRVVSALAVPVFLLSLLVALPFALAAVADELVRKRENTVRKEVSRTALAVASVRFCGHLLGWISDPGARRFLSWTQLVPAVAFALHFVVTRHMAFARAFLIGRTQFFDDVVASRDRLKQLVILGAGCDARGHRIRLPPGCTVFEVDAPFTQAFKRQVVGRHPSDFPNHDRVRYVAVDFSSGEDFLQNLVAHGFDVNEPETLFTLEGVTRYLTWDALQDTLGKVTRCAKGTLLVMNVGLDTWSDVGNDPKAAERYRTQNANIAWAKNLGEPVHFGMKTSETPAGKFLPLGFSSVDVWFGPAEIFRRYTRDIERTWKTGLLHHFLVLQV